MHTMYTSLHLLLATNDTATISLIFPPKQARPLLNKESPNLIKSDFTYSLTPLQNFQWPKN